MKLHFLDRSTFVFAALAFGLNAFLWGDFHGFPSGAGVICDFQYPVTKAVDGGPSFWITHSDPYLDLIFIGYSIGVSLLIFLIAKSIERWWIVSFLSLIPLGYSIFCWFELQRIISNEIVSASSSQTVKGFEYMEMMRYNEVPVWILLGMLVLLFLLQLLTAIRSFRGRKSIVSDELT